MSLVATIIWVVIIIKHYTTNHAVYDFNHDVSLQEEAALMEKIIHLCSVLDVYWKVQGLNAIFLVCGLFPNLFFSIRLSLTLILVKISRKDFISYAIIFFTIVFGFSFAAFMFYGSKLDDFSRLLPTTFQFIRMMMGTIEYDKMYEAEPVMTPIIVFTFLFVVYMIILRTFILILEVHLKEGQNQIDKTGTAFLGFVLRQLLDFVRIVDEERKVKNPKKPGLWAKFNRWLIRLRYRARDHIWNFFKPIFVAENSEFRVVQYNKSKTRTYKLDRYNFLHEKLVEESDKYMYFPCLADILYLNSIDRLMDPALTLPLQSSAYWQGKMNEFLLQDKEGKALMELRENIHYTARKEILLFNSDQSLIAITENNRLRSLGCLTIQDMSQMLSREATQDIIQRQKSKRFEVTKRSEPSSPSSYYTVRSPTKKTFHLKLMKLRKSGPEDGEKESDDKADNPLPDTEREQVDERVPTSFRNMLNLKSRRNSLSVEMTHKVAASQGSAQEPEGLEVVPRPLGKELSVESHNAHSLLSGNPQDQNINTHLLNQPIEIRDKRRNVTIQNIKGKENEHEQEAEAVESNVNIEIRPSKMQFRRNASMSPARMSRIDSHENLEESQGEANLETDRPLRLQLDLPGSVKSCRTIANPPPKYQQSFNKMDSSLDSFSPGKLAMDLGSSGFNFKPKEEEGKIGLIQMGIVNPTPLMPKDLIIFLSHLKL